MHEAIQNRESHAGDFSLMTMTVLRSRRIRSVYLLVRVRPVQEGIVDFDGSDVFSRNERQLGDTNNRSTGDSEPSSARTTRAVDDSDQRRGDGAGQTAAGHGEAVDLAEHARRGRGVLEQDEGARRDDDAEESRK